jgi:mono/diheme cytochrome c family protein
MNMKTSAARYLAAAFAALGVALLAACSSAPGADAAPRQLHQGERLYKVACSGCHGADARGKGPVAPLLGAPVPDLTLIAARRGGTFPVDEIYRIIDGQADLTAHGPRHMPVWGYEFFGDDASDEAAHRAATEKVESVIRFLQSVQRTAAP